MAMTGTEILIGKIIKMIGLDPAIVMAQIENIRKSVSNASGDIANIRRDQLRIMHHLGIESDGQSEQRPNDLPRQLDA